jgi:hypothetical protein
MLRLARTANPSFVRGAFRQRGGRTPGVRRSRGLRTGQMVEMAMTLLTHHGEGPAFPYAGQPMHILAGNDGRPAGFAAMELTVPARFAGPVPHAHDEFDEAIYVLSGRPPRPDHPVAALPGADQAPTILGGLISEYERSA